MSNKRRLRAGVELVDTSIDQPPVLAALDVIRRHPTHVLKWRMFARKRDLCAWVAEDPARRAAVSSRDPVLRRWYWYCLCRDLCHGCGRPAGNGDASCTVCLGRGGCSRKSP